MNERQLESFLAIVKHGSFAAAAERLYVTQSAISARIKELEDDLGVELFDRAQKKVQLTTKGRELIEYAEQVNILFNEIKSTVGSKGALSGVVRIGLVELVAITWMSKLVSVLNTEYPALTVEFEVGLNPFLLDGIRSGNLDMAIIVGELSLEARKSLGLGLASTNLGTTAFAWLASQEFDVGDDVLRANDLRRLPVIYQGSESFMNSAMNEWLSRSGSQRPHGTSCNGLGSIVSLVQAGVGICLLPIAPYAALLNDKKLKILRTDPSKVDITISVLYSQRGATQLFKSIADVCVQVSTFDRSADQV
jgi:DNA-binding transcriptional LysR family regulator